MAPILAKRPVAFRYKDFADGWIYTENEAEANEAINAGHDSQALYVRDGSTITAEWQPIETAPKDPDALFLVCGKDDERGPFVIRAEILWNARKSNTPSHLHLHYLTHWMPLPDRPSVQASA